MFIIRLIDLKFHSLFFFSLTFIFKLSFFFFSFIYRSFFNHLLKNLFVIYVDNIQQVFILILFHFYSWNVIEQKFEEVEEIEKFYFTFIT